MARILAVASGGGHWQQLVMLRPAFAEHETGWATTDGAQARVAGMTDAAILPDCNLDRPLAALRCCIAAAWLVLRSRPQVIISTGAAPGLFCIMWGRLIGARTLWIDSFANAERLSLSGRVARRAAHRCLTQWQHLADGRSVHHAGALL